MEERLVEVLKELEATQVLIDLGNADTELRLKKKELKKEKKSLERRKKQLIRNWVNQAALRKRRKISPVVAFRNNPGRPPVEEKVPELPDLIVKLVASRCTTDPRRRTEIVRCIQTVDELEQALNGEIATAYPELYASGFRLKRSTLYLRLMPRRVNSIEGKRHVRCVPVKARKPQFNDLKRCPELRFTRAQYRMKDQLAA